MSKSVKSSKSSKKKVSKSKAEVVKTGFKLPKFPKFSFSSLKDTFMGNRFLKALLITLFFFFTFVIVDLFVQYLNNNYSVAIVDGVRISKGDYMTRLQKTYGLSTVSALIQEKLIVQSATKEKISVSDEEVQTRLNEYYNEHGGRDSVLANLTANNITENDVREQIRIGLLLEKSLIPKVQYTDKELEAFFNENKELLYGNEKVTFAQKKDEIKDYYVNVQAQTLRDGWIADLEKSAKIQNNVQNKPTYGFLKTTVNIVNNIYNQIKVASNKN